MMPVELVEFNAPPDTI